MRVLAINTPPSLAKELQLRANDSSDFELLLAGHIDPSLGALAKTPFVRIHSRRKIDFAAIRSIRRLILDFQPDVIHSFLPASVAQTVLACVGLKKKPRIVSFYGITRVPSWKDPANWITYLSPKVSMHACESIAVKQALRLGGVPDRKCEIIYNCVEEVSQPLGRNELRQKLGVPLDAFVVGSVATIRPVKGIDVLLHALMQCEAIQNLFAIIAGSVDDPLVEKLALDPRIANRVRLMGFTPNASAIMPAMDVFVMPSRKEGLCRALLEAMGQSICPVVSDAGGMKEIVRDSIDGVVFPSEDDTSLARAIQHLHESPELRAKFAHSARNRVHEMCSPQVVGDRVMQLYHRMAA